MFRRTRVQVDITLSRPQTRYNSAFPNTAFPAEFVKPNSMRFLNSVTYQGPRVYGPPYRITSRHVKTWTQLPGKLRNTLISKCLLLLLFKGVLIACIAKWRPYDHIVQLYDSIMNFTLTTYRVSDVLSCRTINLNELSLTIEDCCDVNTNF